MSLPIPCTLEQVIDQRLHDRLRSLLSVATRSIPRIKNISRIQGSMRVYVATSRGILPGLIFRGTSSTVDLLAFPAHFAAALDKAEEFLRHQFPMVGI